MKAAQSFSFGDGETSHQFKPGDEVPDKIVKELDKDGVADTLILEKAVKENPDSLTREQLLTLAGLSPEEAQAATDEGMTEEELREGMSQFSRKADLIEWAEGVLRIEGINPKDNRPVIEDQIVEAFFGDEDEDDDNDDNENENE